VAVHIGVSGWSYPGWRGKFYPAGLSQRAELNYIAERLATVELNGTFYSLQRPSSYQNWAGQTPPAFTFAVKGSRYITHMRKLVEVDTALANFFASGILALGPKLGPILWQLPPTLPFDAGRIADFLNRLPRSSTDAARLGHHHDTRLREPAFLAVDADRSMEHAVEVRHDSYRDPGFLALLRDQGIGLVVADTARRWPLILETTARLVYVRLHGPDELYSGGYDAAALRRWARRITQWDADGHDVFVYFDNDMQARAPVDAIALRDLTG
jgi:uncharacterized protein YecE (DUF72 family)